MAAARVTAYSHVASFFNVGGQNEKEKIRGGGEGGDERTKLEISPNHVYKSLSGGKLGWGKRTLPVASNSVVIFLPFTFNVLLAL